MTLTRQLNLHVEAQRLCDELSDLLNRTVCTGIRIVSVASRLDHARVVVGYKITARDQTTVGIPLVPEKRGSAGLYLGLSMRLEADAECRYLMVVSSVVLLAAKADLTETLLHYDYERDKADGYPEAHLQVCATSDAWERVGRLRPGGKGRALERLHLPVGPRRYRPTVEDLVEFVICEDLVKPKKGWDDALRESRDAFMVRQLRAAIRRDPDTALEVLRDEGLMPSGPQPT